MIDGKMFSKPTKDKNIPLYHLKYKMFVNSQLILSFFNVKNEKNR